jgi:hypothetical protein
MVEILVASVTMVLFEAVTSVPAANTDLGVSYGLSPGRRIGKTV